MNSKPKTIITNTLCIVFHFSVFPRHRDQKAWFSMSKNGRYSCESSGSEREAAATASEFIQVP